MLGIDNGIWHDALCSHFYHADEYDQIDNVQRFNYIDHSYHMVSWIFIRIFVRNLLCWSSLIMMWFLVLWHLQKQCFFVNMLKFQLSKRYQMTFGILRISAPLLYGGIFGCSNRKEYSGIPLYHRILNFSKQKFHKFQKRNSPRN